MNRLWTACQNSGNGLLRLIQTKPGWSVLWTKNMNDYMLPFALNEKGVSVHFHKEGLQFSGSDNAMNKLMLQMSNR